MKTDDLTIKFSSMQWSDISPKAKEKMVRVENKQLRLIEFEEGYSEPKWCFKEHIGYILKGELTIAFDKVTKTYNSGDGLVILKDTRHRIVNAIKTTQIFLVEERDDEKN